ncbi:MAG: PspC domain-containing protein [Lachnospiraceae bacterium]|nr:PspC domain-containing protein [Lachnospiraceae bacterium]
MDNDYKKLKRSKTNRMICGVCGGLGEYLNIDPTIIRIIWLLCSLAGLGTGAIIYLIAAIVVPEEPLA